MMSTKIDQFINVTGANLDTARKLLNACGGNLDLAIGMYMEDGAPSQETSASNVDHSPIPIPDEDEVRPPILPVRGVLVEDEPRKGRLRRRKRNLPSSVFDPFRDVASEMHSATNNDKKRATLSELYRPPLQLIFQGNFTEAKEAGAGLKKWLLVNVQDAREFSSHILNRDVWNNSKVKNVVDTSFLLWQTYRGSDEASRFCQFYSVYSFPFVAVLDPRTGECVDQWKGNTSKSFLEFVSEFLSTHSFAGDEPSIPQPKKSRIENDTTDNVIDLSEEDQLKAAIAASMSQKSNGTMSDDGSDTDDFVLVESDEDDSSSSKHCAGHDNNTINHSKNDIPATLDPSRLAYLNMTKNLPANKGPKEDKGKGSARRNTEKSLPMQKLSINDDDISDSISSDRTIHLLLRLPAGTRVECTFNENHPVQELFDIVAAQGFNVEEVEVIANFPRRVITMVDCLQSFKDVGLNSRETVFVQIT